MKKRRKAAHDVFREQSVQQQLESEEIDDLVSELQAFEGDEAENMGYLAERAAPPRRPERPAPEPAPQPVFKTSEELQLEKEPVRVRETGFWLWRRIIVPPNAYVIHTRMGRKDPVTLGLGLSFHYNPNTDAYLIVPTAMQTIGIVANCISREKQGINVLAYVQWQIDDFSVAYRKLDFSDINDPLGIVNAQLREQAEAAIKDKIATMSVEEVLTDKAPIIEELTTRLKAVAEGRSQGDQGLSEGLGIKIVTVQIKEALVSSQRLWENLQAPFRYEKEKTARISFLTEQDAIRQKELETRRLSETRQAETTVEIERIKQSKQTEGLEIRVTEEATRFTKEQEAARQKIQLEEQTTLTRRESEQRLADQAAQADQAAKLAALQREQEEVIEQARLDTAANARTKTLEVEQALQELTEEARLADARFQAAQEQFTRDTALKERESEFKRLVQEQQDRLQNQILEATLARTQQETQTQLELEEATNRVKMALVEQEVKIEERRQEIRNLINDGDLASRLVDKLPELAAQMPEIHELKVLQTGGTDGAFDAFATFLAQVLTVAESLGIRLVKDQNQET
jgi:flotillin